MSYLRYVLRRGVFATVSVYLAVTVAFVFGRVIARADVEKALANARYRGFTKREVNLLAEDIRQAFGLDQSLLDGLIDWWINVLTLDWGYSTAFEQPVIAVLDGRILTTLGYVIPGLVLAVILGVLFGLWAALARNRFADWAVRLGSYGLLGIPIFMVGVYVVALGGTEVPLVGGWRIVFLPLGDMTVAAIAVAVGLLAGQIRFARAAALEQIGEPFVKMLRAKGAGRLRLARHVFRNAVIPIVSLSISELLSVLVLNIYAIERFLGIEGLAEASLRAIGVIDRPSQVAILSDISLLMWSVMVIVFVGITLSFLQDVLYGYLDPRVRAS